MIRKIKSVSLIVAMMAMNSYAQDAANATAAAAEKAPESIGSNPLFLSMAILTAVLLMVIFILSAVLRTSVKTRIREVMNSRTAQSVIALFIMLTSQSAFAQTAEAATESLYIDTPIGNMHPMAFYSLFGVLIVELLVILWLCLMILRIIVKKEEVSAAAAHEVKSSSAFSTFISRKLFGVKPVETDKDVLLDHDYDGIKELDNDLPPWWKYGFYLTIISSVVYMVGYHITGSFKLSHEEYVAEVAEGEAKEAAYRAKMAMNVDETNAVFLTDADKIAIGKDLFMKNCVACHGDKGQGIIGPNLTDNHWLYGNKPGEMYKIVKDGTSKGMRPWKDDISAVNIQNIISFIHTLKGTNPAGAKAPEGELIEDDMAVTPSDSAVVNAVKDSVKSLEVKL